MDAEATARRRIGRWAPIAVALSILVIAGILLWVDQAGDLRTALGRIDWRVLPLALALHVAAHVFWAARLTLISRGTGIHLGPVEAWGIITAGTFGGAVTPGRIGGEVLKLTLLLRRGAGAGPSGRLLVADRGADLVFFMILGLIAVALLPPLFGAQAAAARAFAMLGSIMLGVFLLLLTTFLAWPARTSQAIERAVGALARLFKREAHVREPVHQFLLQAREGLVDVLGRRPRLMAAAMALTALNWIVEYGAIWALLVGFGFQVPFWAVFFVGIVLTMVANIPITPGGAGVAEVAALALLTPLAPGLSPLFVVAWRGMTYDYDLAIGGATASVLLARPHKNG